MTKTVIITPPISDIIKKIVAVIADPASRRRLLTLAVLELKDLAAGYPVAGAWNSAPGSRGDGRWYQRGYGSRWFRNDGSIGGNDTSQRLQESWRTEQRDEFTAAAFTEVTYAPYLLNKDERVHWAASHGWKSLGEIEEEYAPRFEKLALDEIDNQIGKI